MSVKRNLLKNGIATSFQKLVTVGEQLLLVPFFISAWGAEYYGEWLTLTIIPSMLAFSDLGFGSSAASAFVLKYAAGDKQGAADIGKTGAVAITGLILLGVILSILTIAVLAHYHLFERMAIDSKDAIWSVSILILARLVSFYKHLFEGYFRAARRASLSINLWSLHACLNLIAGACTLLMGYGIVAFALSQLIVSVLFNLYYAKRGISLLNLGNEASGRVTKGCATVIATKGFGYLLSPVWQSIFFQGTTLAVRLTLGAEAVAVFNTVRTLSRSVNQFYSMVNSTVFPELQYEIGAGNTSNAHRLFRVSIFGVFLMAVVGGLLLWAIGPWVYQLWTRNELEVPPYVWEFFVIGIFFNALWWSAGMVFRAVNKPYRFALAGLIGSLIAVALTYYLSLQFGLAGAAVGYLFLDLAMALYILPVSCRILNMSLSDFFKHGSKETLMLFSAVKKRFTNSSKYA